MYLSSYLKYLALVCKAEGFLKKALSSTVLTFHLQIETLEKKMS